MSHPEPPHLDTAAGLSAADRTLLQSGADHVGAHLELKPGDRVGVFHAGKVHVATVSERAAGLTGELNLCSSGYCKAIQAQLNAYCAASQLPPGTPVPVIDNGKLCYCVCCS